MSKDVEKNGSWSDLADPMRVVEKKPFSALFLKSFCFPQ